MNKEQFLREKRYGVAIAIAAALRAEKLITDKEWRVVQTALRKKYRPMIGSLREKGPGSPSQAG